MRGVRKGAIWAGLIVLAAGHVAYWYWPREHPGAPSERSPVADLLAAEDLAIRAWVAYPHQNLAFLARGDSGANWRIGLSELAGVPPIELPGFGPFPLPPASELAVATDASGRRLRVAARVYPVMAWIARAAGRLAGNPWLAGRRLEVAWQGRTWTLRSPGDDWPAGGEPPRRKVLALVALDAPIAPFPPGRYRIVRRGRHLDLLSDAAPSKGWIEPSDGVLNRVEKGREGVRASAVLGPGQGSLRGIPSAVVFSDYGKPPPLPFERLYRLLGIRRREARVGPWRLVASDRLALARGRELVSGVERAAAGDVRLVYSVDLDVVRGVSAGVEKALEGLPRLPIPEVDRWRGASRVLVELGAYDRWTLEVDGSGREVRSRLWRAD